MGSRTNYSAGQGVTAESVVAIAGTGNQYLKEDTVQMSDNAQVVGGDKVEFGGSLSKSGGDMLTGGSVRVSDNSSYYGVAMDSKTENVLLNALAVSARNAENFMTLASGGTVSNPQENPAVAPNQTKEQNALGELVSLGKKAVIAAVIITVVIVGVNYAKAK